MIISILYMLSEFFRQGTVSVALLLVFMIADVATIEALTLWLGRK